MLAHSHVSFEETCSYLVQYNEVEFLLLLIIGGFIKVVSIWFLLVKFVGKIMQMAPLSCFKSRLVKAFRIVTLYQGFAPVKSNHVL